MAPGHGDGLRRGGAGVFRPYAGAGAPFRIVPLLLNGDAPERPASATLSYSAFDFSAVLSEHVFMGFTASTGEGFNDHDLVGPASFSTALVDEGKGVR